jgi:glutamate-1-semialdehyde aminotransferase
MICLAKSIGGGLPLGAFGASKKVMGLISDHKVFHGGTYNTNRVAMAAGPCHVPRSPHARKLRPTSASSAKNSLTAIARIVKKSA